MSTSVTFAKDAFERVLWTFIQAFAGVVAVAAVIGEVNLSIIQQGAVAGIAAVVALVKAFIARTIGDPNSAALLPDAAVGLVERAVD